ncbi:MAG: 16S rRNA (guanine(527)-N(7))-methyltransferase RsmG [Acidiferrobacterales bacterium]
MELAECLATGLDELGLCSTPAAHGKLLQYVRLLEKWNRVYNLTAVRDARAMVTRHILDSAAIVPWVMGPRVLDVGTGAGLPGIPLALLLPATRFVLLDSRAKKSRFVRQVVAELELANVEVVCERAEKFQPAHKFDTLATRALAPITDILATSGHLCAAAGHILIMKGTYPREELTDIPDDYALADIKRLHVPGLAAERHLVIIERR